MQVLIGLWILSVLLNLLGSRCKITAHSVHLLFETDEIHGDRFLCAGTGCVHLLYCAFWTYKHVSVCMSRYSMWPFKACMHCAFACVRERERECTRGVCGISTQNHVRAVTSRAEIGLVSPVIRRRGERGKRRKLEERKRLFHHHYLPLHLHLHNNFISNSRHWMHNRTAMPLWNQLKLMEYLYADCGTLNFLFSPQTARPPLPCFYLSF